MTDDFRIGREPEPSPTTPRKRRTQAKYALIGAVVLMIVALGVVAILWRDPASDSDAITVHGRLDLVHAKTSWEKCVGQGGYSDIHEGAQVVISDATGKTIAIGQLKSGIAVVGVKCSFYFTVEAVPGDEDFYGIEVSHRGRVQYSRAQLDELVILSLG